MHVREISDYQIMLLENWETVLNRRILITVLHEHWDIMLKRGISYYQNMQLEHLDIMLDRGILDYQTLLLEQWDILLNGGISDYQLAD